jgi:hypothetical protein
MLKRESINNINGFSIISFINKALKKALKVFVIA